MARCRICGKMITASHKIVRIVVEAAYRDRNDDRRHPERWSVVEEWSTAAVMHLGCVQWLRENRDPDLPYGQEIDLLDVDEIENAPVIAGVPRSKLEHESSVRRRRNHGGRMLRVIEGGRLRR